MQTPGSLPDEIQSAENTAYQLLSAGKKSSKIVYIVCLYKLLCFDLALFLDFPEEVKLTQLAHLNKELEAVRDQDKFVKTDLKTQKQPDACH